MLFTSSAYGLHLDRLCGILAVVMIAGLVTGQIGAHIWAGFGALTWLAAAAAVVLALLRLGSVQRMAQIFALLSVLVALAIALLRPEALPHMQTALFQGTAFSAFLTSLGLIRAPVRASRLVAQAAARLFAASANRRAGAVTFGAQGLSVLFNIGTIGMMSDIAENHARHATEQGRPPINTRVMTLCALRGTVLSTIWNPIGVGFAIVTTAIPTLDPVAFLLLALASAFVITCGTLWALRKETAADHSPDPDRSTDLAGGRALAVILSVVLGLIIVTLVLHRLLEISFLVAACVVLPILSWSWPFVEPEIRAAMKNSDPLGGLGKASASMANEATIFLAAAVIGAGVTVGFALLGWGAGLGGEGVPALVPILGCLFLVPLAAALLIPHSVVVVMIAQLLGAGPIGAAHPLALGLSLCLAWALAISASPISAMSIITGRQLAVPAARIPFDLNRRFTLVALGLAAALLVVTYFWL
ncbi:hypothetical protein RPE78_17065 (plasmid) [Thioclava litoralis]|uniref:Uncharacterized protein n=1 Tax=Thioclava litoralis TaxID=3076557 RepID=A0ABZ1E3F1_9RHOB|nr:hypothetical protein RPE78_17065 [Thioclava sp. FTW29]